MTINYFLFYILSFPFLPIFFEKLCHLKGFLTPRKFG